MSDSPSYHVFVGINIAAATFTASWATTTGTRDRPSSFAQTPEGFAAFQHALSATTIAPAAILVVMEATSSYWVALAVVLHEAGFQVSVLNPKVVYNYAQSLPRRGKTDALDAEVLQHFAVERQPPTWTPPPTIYHELRQRLVARDAVAEMRQQARNQRHALRQWPVQVATVMAQFDAIEADLSTRLHLLDTEIAQLLDDGAWAASASLLQSIPGIGPLTTAWLLVATVNFELCASAEAAVAYVGLNPLAHESGTSVRGRAHVGRGGHRRLRKALYLASLSAAQYNPVIRPFYARLRAAGKPAKVAHCAAARKLLHLAWAVVTKQQRFDPQHAGGGARPNP